MKNLFKILMIGCVMSNALAAYAQDDWANLKAYREDNAKLLASANHSHQVVFMGNSITIGWKLNNPKFWEENGYINRGISGQTTPQMLLRFRQDVIRLKPKVVVILAGTNDIAGNTGPSTLEMIEDNIASMAELAKANEIKVILSSVLPVLDYPWKKGLEPAPKIAALNQWIKTYANEKGHLYLDYYSSLVDEKGGMKASLANDGVHPNARGYEIMQSLLQQTIANALNKPSTKS